MQAGAAARGRSSSVRTSNPSRAIAVWVWRAWWARHGKYACRRGGCGCLLGLIKCCETTCRFLCWHDGIGTHLASQSETHDIIQGPADAHLRIFVNAPICGVVACANGARRLPLSACTIPQHASLGALLVRSRMPLIPEALHLSKFQPAERRVRAGPLPGSRLAFPAFKRLWQWHSEQVSCGRCGRLYVACRNGSRPALQAGQ